jgi:hypothetical protein
MNSFLKGFFSLFNFFDCYHDLSPSERVDEMLDNFYLDHPYIERDDNKALEKDFKKIWKNNES